MDKLRKCLFVTACLVTLVAANVWAQESLDKSSSLTIERDSRTGSWMGICDASVKGIDPRETYGGVLLVFLPPPPPGPLFTAIWEVSPQDRTFTDSDPGIWTFRAKLRGRTVTIQAEVTFGTIAPAGIRCDHRFDRVDDPGFFGTVTNLDLTNP